MLTTDTLYCAQQAVREFSSKIVFQRKQAIQKLKHVRSDPVCTLQILTELCGQMLAYSSSPASNFIHYSTCLHSTATVFCASQAAMGPAQSHQQASRQMVVDCVAQLLQKVQAVLPQLRAQEASNILWSCARLTFNPDSVVPRITLNLMSTVVEDQSAVAQNLSNAVWAVATLKDAGQLAHIDMIVIDNYHHHVYTFHGLCVYPSNKSLCQQPKCVQFLWAAAALDLSLAPTMLDMLCAYLVHLVQQPLTKANVVHSMLPMPYGPATNCAISLSQCTCSSFCKLAHFSSLCTVHGRQPNCQNISNVVLATASLSR